jgi:hypothetical protein
MAIAIDVSQLTPGLSKRELIRACGLSVGLKGRFKPEALAIIKLAEDAGYTFDTPAAVVKASAKATVSQKEIDLLAFREWEVSKGYEVSEKRISNARINEYVTENPDFKRREANAPKSRVAKNMDRPEVKPLPPYDVKDVKKFADDNDLEYNDRGRMPRWIIDRYFAEHEANGTKPPVIDEPENMFADTQPRINPNDHWEAIDLDGKKIRKSFKDCSTDSQYSIGWTPRPVFAWSNVNPDVKLELEPVS